jgi:hypothetical protein
MTSAVAALQALLEDWLLTQKGVACRLVLEGDVPPHYRSYPDPDPPVELETRAEHVRDVARRVGRGVTGSTEGIAEIIARDAAAPVIFVAHRGPTAVEPRLRLGGAGLWAKTAEVWIAIRPDGWPVLAPGPKGSVDTWPTKAGVQGAIDAVKDAERSRR